MYCAKSAIVPLALIMGLDFWFTLIGQPEYYWQGNYNMCMEMSPVGKALLRTGPAYFIVAYILYATCVCLLVGRLHKFLDTAIIMWVLLGHVWGSTTWLPLLLRRSLEVELSEESMWCFHMGYLGIIAMVWSVCFRIKKEKADPTEPFP